MRIALALLALLPATVLLPACAVDELGGSPALHATPDGQLADFVGRGEDEVRERLGVPYDLREAADGTRYLRYVGLQIGRYGVPSTTRVVVFRIEDGVVVEVARGDAL